MYLPHLSKFNLIFSLLILHFGGAMAQTSIQGGEVSGVWTKTGSPYLINGDITVPQNQTLSIEPGVEIRFAGHYGLYVNGSLQARGAVRDSVSFTVSDTTGFYKKAHIGWKGIRFQNVVHADSSYLVYAVLEYGKISAGADDANGGALYINAFSKINFRNSTIRYSRAKYGGAIFLRAVAETLDLRHLTIVENYAAESGGAIYAANSKMRLFDCKLIGNTGYYGGGGIYAGTSDLRMIKSLVVNNTGGGIQAHWLSAITIDNSTVAGNRGAPDGFSLYRSTLHCKNSILWNKSNNNTYPEISAADYSEVKLDYCIIKGQLHPEWKISNSTTLDPKFSNLTGADARLSWSNYPAKDATRSPAIDAGDPASTLDADGSIADIGAISFMQTSDAYPTVSFVADTTLGVTPLTISFKNYTTQAAGTIVSWHWDFGDGSSSDQTNPIHIYEQSGTYDVKLMATNHAGKKDSLVRSKYVRALAGTIVNSAIVSGTWTKAKSPYNIYNDILIPAGDVLSIEPGVQVIFFGHYKLTVNGSLQASGTESDSIRFTRFDSKSSWHSLRIENVPVENDSTILDYCTIEYAKYISGDVTTQGGNAVLVKGFDKVRVSNCLIQKNIGGRGAGIYAENADILIRKNHIRNNSTNQYGAGIYINNCSPLITGNTVMHNYGNTAGGIYLSKSTSTVSNNNISRNSCYWSGAGLVISESNIYLYRNIIAFNDSGHDRGGGMAIYSCHPKIINNTISYNRAEGGEGVYINGTSRPDFINNIIYSNRDRYQNYNRTGEIYIDSDNSDPNFYNCNIQGGVGGITLRHGTLNGLAENNIDSPPLFADTVKGDFSLTWTEYPAFGKTKSPCIDAGKFDSVHDPDGSVSDIGARYFHQDHKKFEPRPDFSADTVLGFNTLEVRFSDLSDAGNSPLNEWHWDFGDGHTSTVQNPVHTYSSAGFFDVTLSIKDENGFEKVITKRKLVRMYEGTYITGNIEGVFSDPRYLVGGNITIPVEKGLTVNPGVEFVFFGDYDLEVYGSLKALGTPDDPIRFTSYDTTGFRFENYKNSGQPGGWGGIYIYISGPRDSTIIDHCKIEFVENINKGAIYAFSNAAGIRISNNEISYNSTQGVIANSSYLIVRNNYIHHNYASSYGSGSGIYCLGGTPKVVGNIICSNRTPAEGGGIAIQYSRPSIINNVICHNYAWRAGGICDYEGSVKLINNTICYNGAESSAGGYYVLYAGDVTFINTILAGNFPGELEIADPYTRVGFSHSILKGGTSGIRGYKTVFLSENLLNVDPLIAENISMHGRLNANSPAIDAGTLTNVQTSLPATDLLGHPRIANGKVDIGAYEYAATQGVARNKSFTDQHVQEDFCPFSIGLDSIFSYAHGQEYLKFEIVNAVQTDVVDASVVNRHLNIKPVADKFGKEQIIVRATDGITEVKDTLTVNVSPVDDPAIFSIAGNLILLEDFNTEVNYNISASIPFGEDNPAPVYSLAPSSADFVNISFSSSGTLKFIAKENAFGAADFTLTVSDGLHSYSRDFSFAVTAVNDAPVISVVPAVSVFSGEKKKMDVSVHDVEGEPVTFRAFPNNGIVTLDVVQLSENEYSLDVFGAEEGKSTLFILASDHELTSTVRVDVVVNVVTSVEEGFGELTLQAYPNPAKDFIIVEGADPGGIAVLYNSEGEKISSHLLVGSPCQVDIGKLNAGIYFFRVGLRHKVVTYRVIKR